MRDPHKIFVDDESYNSGHGKAYEFYGVDPKKGAMVVVRPDQYVSAVLDVGDCEALGEFFRGVQDGRTNGRKAGVLEKWEEGC